ncbi:MAG: hypothetical protein ACUVXI_02560 [bacterium]
MIFYFDSSLDAGEGFRGGGPNSTLYILPISQTIFLCAFLAVWALLPRFDSGMGVDRAQRTILAMMTLVSSIFIYIANITVLAALGWIYDANSWVAFGLVCGLLGYIAYRLMALRRLASTMRDQK